MGQQVDPVSLHQNQRTLRRFAAKLSFGAGLFALCF
jgi:hypothetical protein